VYPDPLVEKLIRENFVPVRIHVKDPGATALMERFGANWTPTIILLDANGTERHRIEGFLPREDFLAQLIVGLGHIAFAAKDWAQAERRFAEALDGFPNTDGAAEAQYWKGVARYKGSGDAAALSETARAFKDRYAESPWAKKAAVWAG
jgi:hypothetical protein